MTVCHPELKKVKTAVHQLSTTCISVKSVCSLHYDLFRLHKVSIVLHKYQLFRIIREQSCLMHSNNDPSNWFYGWSNCQKGPITIRFRYPVFGTILAGTGTGY